MDLFNEEYVEATRGIEVSLESVDAGKDGAKEASYTMW